MKKLDPVLESKIVEMYRKGVPCKAIALKMGISLYTVLNVKQKEFCEAYNSKMDITEQKAIKSMIIAKKQMNGIKIGDTIKINRKINMHRSKSVTGIVIYKDIAKLIVQIETWDRQMFTLSDFLTKKAIIEIPEVV